MHTLILVLEMHRMQKRGEFLSPWERLYTENHRNKLCLEPARILDFRLTSTVYFRFPGKDLKRHGPVTYWFGRIARKHHTVVEEDVWCLGNSFSVVSSCS